MQSIEVTKVEMKEWKRENLLTRRRTYGIAWEQNDSWRFIDDILQGSDETRGASDWLRFVWFDVVHIVEMNDV